MKILPLILLLSTATLALTACDGPDDGPATMNATPTPHHHHHGMNGGYGSMGGGMNGGY